MNPAIDPLAPIPEALPTIEQATEALRAAHRWSVTSGERATMALAAFQTAQKEQDEAWGEHAAARRAVDDATHKLACAVVAK